MLKQISEQELLREKLTEQQKQELLALSKMSDEDIDLSDIPEVDFSKIGFSYRGPMVRLRKELREYFCDLATRKGVSMNDLVNETLAKVIELNKVTQLPEAREKQEPAA